MASTYSGDPSNSDKDAVRFLIGDTDSSDWILSNEEITYLLTQEGSIYRTCVEACRSAAAKYAREVETTFGAIMKAKLHQKGYHYLALSRKFEKKAAFTDVKPWAGGISKTQKDSEEARTDRVRPKFTKDLHDFPNSATESENLDEGWADPV